MRRHTRYDRRRNVGRALDEMKNNKSSGEDGITIEAIKFGGETLLQTTHLART